MSIRSLQTRFRWLAWPTEVLNFVTSPNRWACAVNRLAGWTTRVIAFDSTGLGRFLMGLTRPLGRLRAALVKRSSLLMHLEWRIRKLFWAFLWTTAVGAGRYPRKASVPRREKSIHLISAPESYPDFQAPTLLVPTGVPCAEESLLFELAAQVIHVFQDVYPIATSYQPVASTDPRERVRAAYSLIYRLVKPAPVWHPDLVEATKEGNLLGALGAGGPFAKLLERAGDGDEYLIDLRHLSDYPVRPGLRNLGCAINYIAPAGKLTVKDIERDGERIAPDDPRWELTERVAIAALVTHLTVWRQGMEYHVGGLAPVPVATHNLPPAHPLRRLLAAHMAQHLTTANFTHLTLRRAGFDVTGFSFSYDTILRYYDDGAGNFDISRLDVAADAARRGIPDSLEYPYLPLALRYWSRFESYVRAWVEYAYPDEELLQADSAAHVWFESLDRHIVNGIRRYAPSLTKENLIKLCTLIIYSLSVGHGENSLRNYAVFLPTTVREDGLPQSVGEVQLVMNFQFLITSPATLLLDDVSHMALDEGAAEIMRSFRSSFMELQEELESEPDRYWQLYPKDLEASVSM